QVDPLYNVMPDSAQRQPRRANRYTFSGNNPLRYVDPDGREIYWVIRTNSRGIDIWSAQTRAKQIRESKNFDPKKDIVLELYVPDLGKLESTVEFLVSQIAHQYGYTREVFITGHAAPGDGPRGDVRTSGPYDVKDSAQMTKAGWAAIDFNVAPDGSAQFVAVGCRAFPWLRKTLTEAQPGFGWAIGHEGWSYPSRSPYVRSWSDEARDAPVFMVGTTARSDYQRERDSAKWDYLGTDTTEPMYAVSPSGELGRAYVDHYGDTTIKSSKDFLQHFGQ
ncbi:MAG TPA: hypothetical protein VM261_08545, partial [Kofleriaceae bacterium]|nr:hypothetical protein [Kofleriaceae bacterium]